MDDLHDLIADYLRGQRPGAEAGEREALILALWRARREVPRCQVCGTPVDDDGGLFDLADLRARRACHLHYAPFDIALPEIEKGKRGKAAA